MTKQEELWNIIGKALLILLILIALFLTGCQESVPNDTKLKIRMYEDGLNYSTIHGVDSIYMISRNEAIIWIDGQKNTIKAHRIGVGRGIN